MLSQSPEDTAKKTMKDVIHRRLKIRLTIVTICIAILLTIGINFSISIIKHRQASDIITSAKEEANQILSEAEDDASKVKYEATKDASEKADIIKKTAENEANTIVENAEVKADEIIDTAINTQIDEVQTLLAITEAEAGGQPVKGKAAVAATIKNRVVSEKFKADTVKEVVFSPGQFDCVSNGKIYNVTPSPSTIEGVKLCLQGKDYSNGALYFYNPSLSGNKSRSWFNSMQTTAIIGNHVFKK
jgi:N-acetylmuramoyl-L-alanine amidase